MQSRMTQLKAMVAILNGERTALISAYGQVRRFEAALLIAQVGKTDL